jgi:hypothetical protein
MIILAMLLVVLNILFGSISITGKPLKFMDHPILVRLRYLAFGMFIGMFVCAYEWSSDGHAGWICIILLAVTTVRVPASREWNQSSPKKVQNHG